MKVKELKELLSVVDDDFEVKIFSNEQQYIESYETSQVIIDVSNNVFIID